MEESVTKMSKRSTMGLVVGWALVLLMAGMSSLLTTPLRAQSFYGTLVGTVTDTSGAAVPGATVTVTNIGTNETHTMKSEATGNYNFVNMVPANYKLEIQAANFKHFVRSPIQVQVGATVRIDAALQVGATTETVEVTTQAPLLQTESGQMSSQVEGKTVQEMPLNGRNTMNLIALTAGVVPQGASMGTTAANQNSGNTQNQGWGNYQIGGGLAGQSAQYVDGVAINVLGNTIAYIPTQDTVQEFNVASNSVSADFGRFGGGVVNMTTKSGTNAFHGSVYEYLRNTSLNANAWFNKANQIATSAPNKPTKLNQNQYGISASGPVIRNKFFFMFSWESLKLRFAQASATDVPTTNFKKGYIPFMYSSGNLINVSDPTGNCNVVKDTTNSRWDLSGCTFNTASKQFLQYFPDSNTGSSTYYYRAVNVGNDSYQYNGRGDFNVSDKQRVFARYAYWNLKDISFNQFPEVTAYNLGNGATFNVTHVAVLGDTYTINPTTILDLRVSWIRNPYLTSKPVTNADLSKFFPSASFTSQEQVKLLPTFSLNNKRNFYSAWSRGPFGGSVNNNYQVSANLVKIVGSHSVKVGTELRIMNAENTGGPNGGSYQFNGLNGTNYTGDEWADFLLGYAAAGSISQASPTTAINHYMAYYVTDTWQYNKKLTLNLGLRWEFPGTIIEAHDKLLELMPNTVDPNTGVNGTLSLVSSALYPSRAVVSLQKRLIAPRIGFAYRLSSNMAIRGGYGITYVPPDIFAGAIGPGQSSINSSSTTLANSSQSLSPAAIPNGFVYMTNPFPNGLTMPSGRTNPSFMTARLFTQAISGGTQTSLYPYMQQWNLSISRQMKGDWMVDVGYAGSKGTHMAAQSGAMNALSPAYWGDGVSLATANLNTDNAQKLYITTPNGLYTSPNKVTLGQSRRPYPYYTNFSMANPYWGATTYHSLQIKAEKRFKSGGMVMGSYTWSKMIGNTDSQGGSYLEPKAETTTNASGYGTVQNPANHAGERSILSFNVPNRIIISYVMPLPIGKGQKYLSSVNGALSRVVSGWAVNGIVNLQTGFPLGVTEQASNNLTGSFGYGTLRPDYIAGCAKTVTGSTRARRTQWFNTACFQAPGTAAGKVGWALGNESRVDGTIKSEGVDNWDFSILKSTDLFERTRLEFRAEFFNLFNRTQFSPPYTFRGNVYFGQVRSQANQPRLAQFSLRVSF